MTQKASKYSLKSIITSTSAVLGLVIMVFIIMGHLSKTYAKKTSLKASNVKIEDNATEIEQLRIERKINSVILCGIVIDLQLPTGKDDCGKIINN